MTGIIPELRTERMGRENGGVGVPGDGVKQHDRRPKRRPGLRVEDYVGGVLDGDRAVLGRAITLVESRHPRHRQQAQEVLTGLLPHTGKAHRLGITGVPGVGKSTFLENLGMRLIDRGHRVAVLAVDPSSTVTGGSILGDKTRMQRLGQHRGAFVRPSPSGGTLGGVARKTRETLLLCEAAGFDVIFVETVGVGQSEAMVADMVDSVLLLLLPGGGDELQGIKRGLLERVDLIAINKADGTSLAAARKTRTHYLAALKYVRPGRSHHGAPVHLVSGLQGTGIDELWAHLDDVHRRARASGTLDQRRSKQQRHWMWALVEDGLLSAFQGHDEVARLLPRLEREVEAGTVPPSAAAMELLKRFGIEV